MYNAIVNLTLRSMANFTEMIRSDVICTATLSMNGKSLNISPSYTEVKRYLHRVYDKILDCSKGFVRWRDGAFVVCVA